MANVEDLTVEYVDDGVTTVKEVDKIILSKGAWATVIFKYQEWRAKDETYGPTKFTIRRYQKRNDEFWQKSKFNISSIDQAKKIIDALNRWVGEEQD